MSGLPKEITSNQPAGFFSRLEAFMIDLVFLSIGSFVAVWLVRQTINFFRLNLIFSTTGLTLPLTIISLSTVLFYFLFFWTLLGYTPGKFLLGLKIVRSEGQRISLGRSFLRFIGYWISAIPLFLGFIWIIFDRRRQGWHDKLADTQVIYTWKNKTRS